MGKVKVLVLVADRNQLVADALVAAFVEVTAVDSRTATTLGEALVTAQATRPDLVLVDAWIAPSSVEDIVRQLKEVSPQSSVYVVASQIDAAFERRVKSAGGNGSCIKESVPDAARMMLAGLGACR
ncbi:MAG TPA: hypothetical protein VI384_02205 [Candidatus Dormibacteraeota bacterium]